MNKSRKKSCAVNVGRWMSYAAAGAATAMAATNDAEATIWYSGIVNTPINTPRSPISPPNDVHVQTLSATHKNILEFSAEDNAGNGQIHLRGSSIGSSVAHVAIQPYGSPPYAAERLAAGVKIATQNIRGYATAYSHSFNSQTMGFAKGAAGGPWSGSGTTGFLAFEFKITPTSPELYGWAKVENTDGGPWNDLELISYAYSDNANFQTGQTAMPEPATLGLLAMGAVGLLAARIGRKNRTPA